jgi:hypothetical protein
MDYPLSIFKLIRQFYYAAPYKKSAKKHTFPFAVRVLRKFREGPTNLGLKAVGTIALVLRDRG